MTAADDPTPTRPSDGSGFERLPVRHADIGGGLPVARALPSARRRTVGAWCFLDHAGPARFAAGEGMRVGPHPHIGLQTFTWMIEGEVLHRDSLGSEQLIRPGQVNLMTAGGGIAHSEESVGGALHAAQLWIALPDAERQRAPDFSHHPVLPIVDAGGFRITVLVGDALGMRAPTRVYSPLVGINLASTGAARTELALNPRFEHALLCLHGAVAVDGERLAPGVLLYALPGRATLALGCEQGCQLMLVGGEPFGDAPLIWWNFVARTPAEIVAAADDWNNGRRFEPVTGTLLPRIPAPDARALTFKTGAGAAR